MKVVQFLPTVEAGSGGPVRSTLATCRAVHTVDMDMETTWISTEHGLDPAWEDELRSSLPERSCLRLFPQIGRHTTNVSPALVAWLWRHLGDYDLLVVRALFHPLTSSSAWIARRRKVPYVVVPHGTLSRWTFRHRHRVRKKLYFRMVERRVLARAGCIQYTSEVERLEAQRLSFPRRGTVIPHPFESRFETAESWDRNPDQVLFLSRFDPMKGIDVLLAAFAKAHRQRPGLRLVLAGSGLTDYECEVRRMVREWKLEDVVDFPGFVEGEKKDALLRRSSVFVLPSVRENFCIAAVEALDAGLPVVLSRTVDITPLVEKYQAGQVVSCTPEYVAAAIIDILNEPARAAEMGRAGQRLVRENFAPDVVGPRVAALYRRVAAEKA